MLFRSKKIKGRKRHILTDTGGLLVAAIVHEASVQDRDGAPALLGAVRALCPWLRHVFADGGYAGDQLIAALAGLGRWTIEIVRRVEATKGFQVIKRSTRCVDGSWSAPSLGSAATVAWPRTSKRPSPARGPGSISPLSRS